jgi:hypothetical protein
MRSLLLFFTAIAALGAQIPEPKPNATDYPVHQQVGDLAIGAEYMVHSVSGPDASFLAEDFLVVELALYPPRSGTLVRAREWTLRINGKGEERYAQSAGAVAQSIKYADANRRRRMVVAAGPVVLGQPRPVERFPGDPRGRVPPPPGQRPQATEEPPDLAETIQRLALVEGTVNKPVSGYLFFPWSGKTSKIKSLELIWRPETGEPIVLKIR